MGESTSDVPELNKFIEGLREVNDDAVERFEQFRYTGSQTHLILMKFQDLEHLDLEHQKYHHRKTILKLTMKLIQ